MLTQKNNNLCLNVNDVILEIPKSFDLNLVKRACKKITFKY